MTIGFFFWDTKFSGGGLLILNLAKELEKKGIKVCIFSVLGPKASWDPYKNKISYFPFWLPSLFKINTAIAIFWPTAYIIGIIPWIKNKIFFFQAWEEHSHKNKLYQKLALLALKGPYKLLTTSKYLASKCYKSTGIKPEIITIFISEVFFAMRKKRNKKQNNNSTKRILSVVSYYHKSKGINDLVELIRRIKKKDKNLKFVLVSGEKYAYSNDFDEFKTNLSQEELVIEYRKADLFLNTSRSEGFLLTPLEAMANGCPVIATDSGGINEYAINNENCLLSKNPEDIINNKLIEKILNNIEFKNKLVDNGYETASKYSIDQTTKEFVNFHLGDK